MTNHKTINGTSDQVRYAQLWEEIELPKLKENMEREKNEHQ
jgi:hypothetical protein